MPSSFLGTVDDVSIDRALRARTPRSGTMACRKSRSGTDVFYVFSVYRCPRCTCWSYVLDIEVTYCDTTALSLGLFMRRIPTCIRYKINFLGFASSGGHAALTSYDTYPV